MILLKKILSIAGCFFTLNILHAQKFNWQNLDLKKDSVFGVSTEKAYNELLPLKKGKTIVVAVIDGGTDTSHEDLRSVVWTNVKEIPANNKDDDHNGYIDDVHGWNFIGSAKGNINQDNNELTRLIRKQKAFYDSLAFTKAQSLDTLAYNKYKIKLAEYDQQVTLTKNMVKGITNFKNTLDTIVKIIGKKEPTTEDFGKFIPRSPEQDNALKTIILLLKRNMNLQAINTQQINNPLQYFQNQLDYALNLNYDPRSLVGDDYNNVEDRLYGNADVIGPAAEHGTHVAGIIGANRHNSIGLKGVAEPVKIMPVRVVPTGDERDKDVANGIRYAVANGASIINLSFDKPYSSNKKAVDEAVKYAMSKDVLIIHSSGNGGLDLDSNIRYPNRIYEDGDIAKAWIEVGASGFTDDSTLVALFSNYGRSSVDVFAPGVRLYSSIPISNYAFFDGTSMAAPIVSGIAALVRSYYPKLTAEQVKGIILQTVVKPSHNVTIGIGSNKKSVPFYRLCLSGGIINAYNALKLAEKYREILNK